MSAVQRGKPAASATEVKLCAIQQLTNHFQNAVGRFDERFFRAALASVEVRASALVHRTTPVVKSFKSIIFHVFFS